MLWGFGCVLVNEYFEFVCCLIDVDCMVGGIFDVLICELIGVVVEEEVVLSVYGWLVLCMLMVV